jgi:hypothetical protein
MHPTADTTALIVSMRLGAAGDAGRYAACIPNRQILGGIMKFYVYISDIKVDMLLPQIADKAKQKIATEFKLDLKVLTASRRSETEESNDRVTRLEAVSTFIREYGNVGSLKNPDVYIYDSMYLSMAISHKINFVYFGGFASYQGDNERELDSYYDINETVIGLGGSAEHVIGNPTPDGITVSRSHLVTIMQGMEQLSKLDGLRHASEDVVSQLSLHRVHTLALQMLLKEEQMQKMEFLARTLLYEEDRRLGRVIIATPIYIALADEPKGGRLIYSPS